MNRISALRPLPRTATPLPIMTAARMATFSFRTPPAQIRATEQPVDDRGVEFFRRRRAAATSFLDLRLERAVPTASRETVISTSIVTLDARSADRLRALARNATTEVHSVFLAAWQVLLWHRAAANSFFVGCANACSTYTPTDALRAVHAVVPADRSFQDLIGLTAKRRAEARTRDDVALETVVTALQIDRPGNRHPVFQTAFIQRHALAARTSSACEPGVFGACELACVWEDKAAGLSFRIEHPAAVSAISTLELSNDFERIIGVLMAHPGVPLCLLPLRRSDPPLPESDE